MESCVEKEGRVIEILMGLLKSALSFHLLGRYRPKKRQILIKYISKIFN